MHPPTAPPLSKRQRSAASQVQGYFHAQELLARGIVQGLRYLWLRYRLRALRRNLADFERESR
jgi:hypothetical protein